MARRVARRGAVWTLLLLSLLGTAALHLRVEQRDHSWLLLVDGVPRDPLGSLSESWLRLRRDCSAVATLQPADERWRAAEQVLAEYSPPDSRSVRLASALVQGEWRLVEASFDALAPVAVLLREQGTALRVVEGGVWSGSTRPWQPGPFVRRYLAARVPEAPADLLACFSARPA